MLRLAALLGRDPPGALTFTVTNINDSGAGSLRRAILDIANFGDDVIEFAIRRRVTRSCWHPALPAIAQPGRSTATHSQALREHQSAWSGNSQS
jgi:hypothetical protein